MCFLDLGDEGAVLHCALVSLGGEEGIRDGGFSTVGFVRRQGMDIAADARKALRARGGIRWYRSLERPASVPGPRREREYLPSAQFMAVCR